MPLFEQIPRDYGRLALAGADLTSPWLTWAKYLAHRLAEDRGWGRNIRFAVNRGLALVLTGYVEGDVIRHTEIFAPLRALDLPVGHTVTVLEEMGIFEDDSEPSFERWLAERLEGLANTTGRASNHWISAAMRGWDATLERLRVDRQLEEAMVKGPDPLHLAEVFGLDEKTAMRYADSARALLGHAAEVLGDALYVDERRRPRHSR